MKKQSSIEWLEDGVSIAIDNTSENSINYILEKLFQQAKEMHKQEIIESYACGVLNECGGANITSNEYYKNTYETTN